MKNETLVFVGTYTDPILFGTGKILQGKGEGIYVYRLDPSSGGLEFVSKTIGITNPSYLAFDTTQRFLYAVNELKTFEDKPTGTVSAFSVDAATGKLEFLNRQLTHGTDPCHVLVDARRKHVFVANFMSGSVCVLPVRDDGSLGGASDFIQHQGSSIDPARQKGPHAHSVTLDASNRYAFVPDLGLDRLMVYRFDPKRGMLEPNAAPWIKMKPGAGPRHVSFHPGGRFAYLVNELDSTVAALSYDERGGTFEHLQTVATLPAGFEGKSTCADIQVAPSGTFLYASNRGHDSIVVYRIDSLAGTLEYVAHEPTQGRTPRSFGIDPAGNFLLVANQDSDTLVSFRIDADSGTPEPTGHVMQVPTPVCVKFLKAG
jgi:6-phosphogluconolactonase